jgi:hypothetical protein
VTLLRVGQERVPVRDAELERGTPLELDVVPLDQGARLEQRQDAGEIDLGAVVELAAMTLSVRRSRMNDGATPDRNDSLSRSVQHLAHSPHERIGCERLLQKIGARFHESLSCRCRVGIA